MTDHLGNSAVTYVVIVKRVTHVSKRRGRVLMDVNQGTKESTATKVRYVFFPSDFRVK